MQAWLWLHDCMLHHPASSNVIRQLIVQCLRLLRDSTSFKLFNCLFTKYSIGDKAPVHQGFYWRQRHHKALINWQNIPSKVKDDPNAVKRFHWCCCWCTCSGYSSNIYGMESIESIPTKNTSTSYHYPWRKGNQDYCRQWKILRANIYVLYDVHTDVVSSTSINKRVLQVIPSPKEKITSWIMPLLYWEWECWLVIFMMLQEKVMVID